MAKILYGLLFTVLLPFLLVLFSTRVEISPTIARFPLAGGVLSGSGLIGMLWGMLDIWNRGNGLPMNAFPPERSPELVRMEVDLGDNGGPPPHSARRAHFNFVQIPRSIIVTQRR